MRYVSAVGVAMLTGIIGVAVRAQDATGPVELTTAGQQRIRVVRIADGLVSPWSLAFLPNGRDLLVSERAGRIRIIRDGKLDPNPVWVMPAEPFAPENDTDRLRAVAVHPDFNQNRLLYIAYVKWGEAGNTLAIRRGRFDGTSLAGVEDVFVANAWETSGNLGGRIRFGPDATLYITVGDRDRLCCTGTEDNSLRMKAQALDSHVGKTLRIRDDGTAPSDNPFVNQPDASPFIYTYGHRNGYGLAFHPVTGVLWQAEIGPLGGDEVNWLVPGHNYGWPLVSTGLNYTGSLVSDRPWFRPEMEMPELFWVPSISPSSLTFYAGDAFPAWTGDLFVGALTTRELIRVSFGRPSQAIQRESLLSELGVRIRDVAEGPDGSLYLATETSVGGDAPTGTVLRIEPAG